MLFLNLDLNRPILLSLSGYSAPVFFPFPNKVRILRFGNRRKIGNPSFSLIILFAFFIFIFFLLGVLNLRLPIIYLTYCMYKMSASISERSPVCRNSFNKAKCTSGWADFDLKQRRKHQNLEPDNDSEPYPLLSGSTRPPQSVYNKNGILFEKPFSSVVDPTNKNSQSVEAYEKLKYLHSWADESLIRDVFVGVNNSVDGALSLLEAMLFSENKDDAESKKVEPSGNSIASFDIQCDGSFNKESKSDLVSMLLLGASKTLPIEPEWEEDDIYLIHRRDAIRMIRSASRHSKSANNAYLRGDHTSALQFSLKAQEERTAAEKLNSRAAKEILNIRNNTNDLWTLDLHGLHAAEAVEALCERLQTVESLVSTNCLAELDEVYKEGSHVNSVKFWREHPPPGQRQKLLQVITGKGNHSRGAAALPSAIRNFLSENGYHHDEIRSGVIVIRPKFRQH